MYELMISMTLLLILSGALVESLSNVRRLSVSSENRATLQTMADAALLEVIQDLRRSGSQELAGKTYPYVFDGGAPTMAFIAHAHDPAGGTAEAGDNDFGIDREVVYLLPADADGDRRPDIDVDGSLMWGADEISFVVVTRADGINYLERRVNAGTPRVVGHHVERMVIDTAESSGFAIPLDSIRVRLFFRRTDTNGHLMRYRNEAVVALRNG